MVKLLNKIQFELILFFFLHWHKVIPSQINYCENRGIFALLQNTVLALLRITQYWPQEHLKKFTKKRLQFLLKKSYKLHPEFMKRFPQYLFENFSRFPILGREDLRRNFSIAIEQYEFKHKKRLLIGTTSGTTGIPMRVGVTEKFATQYRIIRRRLFEFAGLRPEEEFIYPRTAFNPHFCDKNVFIKRDLDSLVTSCETFFSFITEKNISAIYAFPSLLLLMRERAEKKQISIPPLKALVTAGEDLMPGVRKILEESFLTRVYNFYASVELSSIGQECEYGYGLHINPEFHFIEILSPSGQHTIPNTYGRIVITPLDLSIFPILRYDTGDTGMILSEACPCGRTLPRLRIRGRNPDVIRTPKGLISPFAFKEIIDRYDPEFKKIKQYQLVLDNNSRLTVLIIPTKKFTKNDRENIENICQRYFGGMINLSVEISNTLHHVGIKTPFFLRRDR